MKKVLLTLAALAALIVVLAAERSESIIYIGGERYYLHSVVKGETIYSLTKLYDVDSEQLFESNEGLELEGLKLGSNIKIPFVDKIKPISSRKIKRDYDSHVVRQGETLYSLSKKYAISVDALMEANPTLDPANISIGDEVYIKKLEQGKSDDEQLEQEIENYKQNLNSVAPVGYEYHIVEPMETTYSLLKRYSMSEEEFFELNPISGGLRFGAIVLVKSVESQPAQESVFDPSSMIFKELAEGETLRISLLLPLSSSGRVLAPFVEFYQGFLLGLEDVKASGRSVELTLFNTYRDKMKIYDIVEQESFKSSHLIVGPIYEELLYPVVEYAQRHSIPVVSPLATLVSSSSEVLFQMAPMSDRRYDKIGEMLTSERNITLIYGSSNDTTFEQEILSLLDTVSYTRHDYMYEHPSVIQKREREYNELVDSLKLTFGEDVEIEEFVPSVADLAQFIDNDEDNTIVVLASGETDVDRILAALASAYVGIVSRGGKAPRFEVVANPAWSRMSNIDRSLYFKDGVVNFSSYHAKRDAPEVKRFDSRYVSSYATLPSLYSYRGYDAAKIFAESMFDGIEGELLDREFTPLQSTYRFEKNNGTKVNTNWMRVEYNKNFTIIVE